MPANLQYRNSLTDYYPFGSVIQNRSWASQAYRFGFNGQEKDNEVLEGSNLYSAPFWEYDSRLGKRWNLDPISQIDKSDYSCFGNSPIWRNDLLGNKFDEASQKEINKHKDKTSELINEKEVRMGELQDKEKLSRKEKRELDNLGHSIMELKNALSEIKVLEESSQIYSIRTLTVEEQQKNKVYGATTYDPKTNVINIRTNGNIGNLAHELKHAYQFEQGKVSFVSGGLFGEWGGGMLNDINDEVEAYQRQFAYGSGLRVKSYHSINIETVRAQRSNYSKLPDMNIDMNSDAATVYKLKIGEEISKKYIGKTIGEFIKIANEHVEGGYEKIR